MILSDEHAGSVDSIGLRIYRPVASLCMTWVKPHT